MLNIYIKNETTNSFKRSEAAKLIYSNIYYNQSSNRVITY
jgi:hypothetical protein